MTVRNALDELQHELDVLLANVEEGRVPAIEALTTLVKAEHAGKLVIDRVRAEIVERVAIIKSLRKMLRDARHEAEHFAERSEGGGQGQA